MGELEPSAQTPLCPGAFAARRHARNSYGSIQALAVECAAQPCAKPCVRSHSLATVLVERLTAFRDGPEHSDDRGGEVVVLVMQLAEGELDGLVS